MAPYVAINLEATKGLRSGNGPKSKKKWWARDKNQDQFSNLAGYPHLQENEQVKKGKAG